MQKGKSAKAAHKLLVRLTTEDHKEGEIECDGILPNLKLPSLSWFKKGNSFIKDQTDPDPAITHLYRHVNFSKRPNWCQHHGDSTDENNTCKFVWHKHW